MATISSTITLVDQMSGKLATIEENINSMKSTLGSIADEQGSIDGFSFDTFVSNAEAAGERIKKVGEGMTVALTAPLLLLGKKMFSDYSDQEAAFVGMTKTVEGTEAQYEALKQTALELSETTPMSYVDLMGIAQTGGNLGVSIDDMEAFMTEYAKLQYATDQHIAGESGAQDVASFLNITEGGVSNIGAFSSAVVDLGNNFNATEDQILALGNRMASAAHLAGMSTPEILGMATAFRAVGINPEAGGSAAAKLIKQMQMAAEVGGTAQQKLAAVGQDFGSGLEFSQWISGAKKEALVGLATQMGMTVDAVKSMGDSWLLMDQFAEASGKTSEQFINDWNTNPADAMTNFFTGLSKLGENGGESILATLDKMGLKEIRESNLIAAMASRPELFASAISAAVDAYSQGTAATEEFNKQMETTESQTGMLENKIENTMANFGDNLVKALQPALDVVNQILEFFNGLSEEQQQTLVETFMVFAAAGPIVTAIGGTVEAIGKISTGIVNITDKIKGVVEGGGLTALLTNPVTWGIVAGAGLLLFIDYLDSIPSKFEELAKGVTDIPITINDSEYNSTMSKIAEVQAALDGLKAGEINPEYENTSAAVSYGYGTNDMFATALAYEAAKSNANINQVASDYAARMNEAQQKIAEAAAAGDTVAAEAAKQEYEGLRTALDQELAALQTDYAAKMAELFNGMASQYPDAAEALTNAASDYDLAVHMWQAMNFDTTGMTDEAAEALERANLEKVWTEAWEKGYAQEMFGYDSLDAMLADFENGGYNGEWGQDLIDLITENMNTAVQAISDNPILSTLLATMLSDPSLTENLDLSQVDGAMENIVKALDFKQSLAAGESPYDWGQYVSTGLAQGISENASAATTAGTTLGSSTISNILSALGVNSPSTYTISAGQNLDAGLVIGINSGSGIVVAAARNLGAKVLAALQAEMGIHSPSTETYWQGEMMVAGYVNAVNDGRHEMEKAVVNASAGVTKAWDKSTWSLIGDFAAMEQAQLIDDASDAVKLSDADVQKIRSLAEREVINHFTTAEVKVEMNNNNTISSDMDIDGIISQLEDKVAERLEIVAEGVYN